MTRSRLWPCATCVADVREALGLLSSMVASGESHSPQSRAVSLRGQRALEALTVEFEQRRGDGERLMETLRQIATAFCYHRPNVGTRIQSCIERGSETADNPYCGSCRAKSALEPVADPP